MKLKSLLHQLDYSVIQGTDDKDIKTLSCHTNQCGSDSVFFAIKGENTDGHLLIQNALDKGAGAVVAQWFPQNLNTKEQVCLIQVNDTREALAMASCNYYGNPSRSLLTIGITGTKGKTTTAFLLQKILEEAGIKTGIIGTVFCGYEGNYVTEKNTTPESYHIQRHLRRMKEAGCKAVVMEVSSQGLKQRRTEGILFDIGIFTNLSEDHIGSGEHDSFQEYGDWKSKLFQQCKIGVFNANDPNWLWMCKNNTLKKIVLYGKQGQGIYVKEYALHIDENYLGTSFRMTDEEKNSNYEDRKMLLPLPGLYNIYNALGAISSAKILGVSINTIETALKKIKIPGRMEQVMAREGYRLFIDYAHNGVALKNLLKTLREYQPQRLVVVFGCGGERDQNRRIEMGCIAAEFADEIVITSDNPRGEEPMHIIEQIVEVVSSYGGSFIKIPQRRDAIHYVMANARTGDIIVIAGKGHENYQIIGTEILHFDDKEEILRNE